MICYSFLLQATSKRFDKPVALIGYLILNVEDTLSLPTLFVFQFLYLELNLMVFLDRCSLASLPSQRPDLSFGVRQLPHG